TLPLATRAREVLGVEGSEALVARARQNFKQNGQQAQAGRPQAATSFVARNLFEMSAAQLVADGTADRWLVDPPREGAFALAMALAAIHQARHGSVLAVGEGEGTGNAPAPEPLPPGAEHWQPPRRIVYVSCNPATLGRDAGLLVHQAGYRCTAAGVVNMFPHTAHVESMAVFELDT
ncbi:MAG: 23S rRNA (uracil(1939)-C(5))-methyltransferase, partial [Ottowia sp.]|nr:23S rRNA (uracil(1939)-C(5))-methyltransferase [Ottowia sp.]